MKILIVEDDTNSRVLLERALLSQGYAVDSTANGVEALTKATHSPPDLIVSDIMMPEMDGFELCRRIKTDERLRAIPFVFYTATFIEPKDEKLAMSLGASCFLVKPMAPEDLFKAIKEIIEEHKEKRLAVPEQPLAGLEELTAMQVEAIARKLDKKVRELEQEREALRQAEARLRLLIQTIPDLIWLKDANGVYLACNPRCENLIGAKEPSVIGNTDYDFYDKELADFFRQKDHEAITAGKSCINTETVTFASDGHMEILETIKTPMFDDQGQLIGVLGIAHDITSMRQAQKRLRDSEERFRQAMEFLPIPIGLADAHGMVIYVNSEFSNRYGYTREDIPSLATWALHAYPDPGYRETSMAQWNDDIAQAARAGTATPVREYHIACKGGEQRQVEITTRPVGDFYVTALNDITDRLALENTLRQSQKMEAIGTLAGGIAHDFNNILTPILGYSELVVERLPTSSAERELVQEIKKAGLRAKELVKQILTFSRQTEQQRQPVMIHLIIKEALKLLRSSIPSTIDIHQDVADCGLVMADPTQIHQVLMNLCTNAYHAMRETGGDLSVSLSVVELTAQDYLDNLALQPGPHVKMIVRDTGCGMSKKLQERIFDPYFTTKKQGEGTGLGLSVVHGIVQSHQGHITVYSELGQGTEFHVYLPQVKALTEGSAEEAGAVAIPRGSGTILVVDDEPAVGELLRQELLSLGYEVVLCSSSTQALETFQQNGARIDLVLTDMTMPLMNGAELTGRIKQLSPTTPVILCTGFSDIIDEEKAKRIRIDGYLFKPISLRQLAQTIHEIMGKKSESGPA